MKVGELVKFYGTMEKAANAIACSTQAVSKWGKAGRIPTDYQIKWELNSNGAMRADLPKKIRTAA